MKVRFLIHAWFMTLLLGLSACATNETCGLRGCSGDAALTAAVQARLQRHPDLGAPESITVQTQNRVVYLSGTASTGLERQIAGSIAESTQGVKSVENEISVPF
jgi:osmotically-inducible protein OsmY